MQLPLLPVKEEGDAQACHGEGDADEAYSLPSRDMPSLTSEEGSEASTDEVGGHEDGVGSVGGFGDCLYAGALVAQLKALLTDIDEDEGEDQSGVGVAEEPCRQPCCKLYGGASDAEAPHSEAWDVLAYAARHECSGHSADAEPAHGVATGTEGVAGKVEGEACPEGEHAAEAEGGTDGVETDEGMVGKDAHHALHQTGIGAGVVLLHAGHQQEGEGKAEEHQYASEVIHRPPTEPFAYHAADNAGSEDAYEQSGEDVAHVAGFVLWTGELSGNGDEQLGDDGACSHQ